VTLQLDQH